VWIKILFTLRLQQFLEDFFFHNKNQGTINKKIAKTKGPLAELVFLAGLSYPPQVELYIYNVAKENFDIIYEYHQMKRRMQLHHLPSVVSCSYPESNKNKHIKHE
jgi:hypothetical protein